MHTLIHYGFEFGFIIFTAILFTYFVIKRKGAPSNYSRKRIIGLLVVGVLIALVLLSSQSLYAPAPGA